MLKWIKSKWQEWNSCKIDNYFGKLDQSMQAVIDKCERIERQLDAEVKLLTEEVALYKGMLHIEAELITLQGAI
jgi:hypothetical protein